MSITKIPPLVAGITRIEYERRGPFSRNALGVGPNFVKLKWVADPQYGILPEYQEVPVLTAINNLKDQTMAVWISPESEIDRSHRDDVGYPGFLSLQRQPAPIIEIESQISQLLKMGLASASRTRWQRAQVSYFVRQFIFALTHPIKFLIELYQRAKMGL